MLKWLVQIVVLVAVLAVFWFLAAQARTNLSAKGIPVSYDWLDEPANIQLGEGIQTVDTDERRLTMSRALWVGMVNTLRIASIGIIVSTIIGIAVGIARLSKNWLARKVSSIYVETLRNVPVLVQIILWLAILGSLGKLTAESGPIPGWVIVSQKGISLPRVFLADGFYQFLSMVLVAMIPVWFVRRSLKRRQDRVGTPMSPGSRWEPSSSFWWSPGSPTRSWPSSDRSSGLSNRPGVRFPRASCRCCSASRHSVGQRCGSSASSTAAAPRPVSPSSSTTTGSGWSSR
ncbi:MAG: ABC transporter permease subunit [Ilumatobacter sp.]